MGDVILNAGDLHGWHMQCHVWTLMHKVSPFIQAILEGEEEIRQWLEYEEVPWKKVGTKRESGDCQLGT